MRDENSTKNKTLSRKLLLQHTMSSVKNCIGLVTMANHINNNDKNAVNGQDKNDLDDITLMSLFHHISECKEEDIFRSHGYKQIHYICSTLQGQLFKATDIRSSSNVAIKKVCKSLTEDKIAKQDDIDFCVSESILKESILLKYLTVDNKQIGNYLVNFIGMHIICNLSMPTICYIICSKLLNRFF